MPKSLLHAVLFLALGGLLAACDESTLSPAGTGVSVTRQSLLPVIDALEPDPAAEGEEVTLRGYFRKLREDDGLFVSFNGYDSQQVTRVSDTVLKAVVPEGASSGMVVVVIGESVGKGRYLKISGKKKKS